MFWDPEVMNMDARTVRGSEVGPGGSPNLTRGLQTLYKEIIGMNSVDWRVAWPLLGTNLDRSFIKECIEGYYWSEWKKVALQAEVFGIVPTDEAGNTIAWVAAVRQCPSLDS